MQLVVVMAVRAAVMAATMTFRISSQMFLFFIASCFFVCLLICRVKLCLTFSSHANSRGVPQLFLSDSQCSLRTSVLAEKRARVSVQRDFLSQLSTASLRFSEGRAELA